MPSAVPLNYATPASRRHLLSRIPTQLLLLQVSIVLLGCDVFIVALPAFGPFYIGSPMSIPSEWAHFALMHATSISSVFAAITIAASFYFPRTGWPLRLARSIAVGLAVYHWFFAPGDGAYGRLLWGSC